jgi:hypothetical protein
VSYLNIKYSCSFAGEIPSTAPKENATTLAPAAKTIAAATPSGLF